LTGIKSFDPGGRTIWTVSPAMDSSRVPDAARGGGAGGAWRRAATPRQDFAGDGRKGAPVHQNSRDKDQKKKEDTRNSLRGL
jgi:hypothetical protein